LLIREVNETICGHESKFQQAINSLCGAAGSKLFQHFGPMSPPWAKVAPLYGTWWPFNVNDFRINLKPVCIEL